MTDVTANKVADILIEMDRPCATLTQLADCLGVGKPTVWQSQDQLELDGRLVRDKAGRATIWYLKESADFGNLRRDDCIQEVIQVIAQDHNCPPSDVPLSTAFKIAGQAYIGYPQPDQWELKTNGATP